MKKSGEENVYDYRHLGESLGASLKVLPKPVGFVGRRWSTRQMIGHGFEPATFRSPCCYLTGAAGISENGTQDMVI